jgi:hypothetical protein
VELEWGLAPNSPNLRPFYDAKKKEKNGKVFEGMRGDGKPNFRLLFGADRPLGTDARSSSILRIISDSPTKKKRKL